MSYPPARASGVVIVGRPVHSILVQFPVVCFTLALLTDIAYWQTANLMWQNFSEWLLFAGLVFGGLAVLAGILELLMRSTVRSHRATWTYAIGSAVVLVLAFFNSLVHAGDGWTAVVPWGLALSLVTVIVMIATCWMVRSFTYRHEMEVIRHV
ncbi:DUF2231 domain-containing protein [Mesorhizobium sp. 10J20-29]